MAVTLAYITERHAYWKERIAAAGVWNAGDFCTVTLRVKRAARTLNGKFVRRVVRTSRNPFAKRRVEDTLIVYDNPWLDSEVKIDSVLVHEMIHQYIYQARLKDTSSHGRLFRNFMSRINQLFPGELHISVSAKASVDLIPSGKRKGTHVFAIVVVKEQFYCCKVMKSAVSWMHGTMKRMKTFGQITEWGWYTSDDNYFDGLASCRTRLHGLRFPLNHLREFIASHQLRPIPSTKY